MANQDLRVGLGALKRGTVTGLVALLLLSSVSTQALDRIRLRTVFGDIFVNLDPDAAPQTVANFLDYLNSGDYEATFFHDSLPGGAGTPQTITAGRFSWPEGSPTGITPVRVGEPVANEFNQSNRRGTIAMLAPEGLPDGATNTWFINVADNLDFDAANGGATVFGTINTVGMQVVDEINAQCVEDLGVDFPNLPLLGEGGASIQRESLILITETGEFDPVAAPLSAILPGSRSVAVDKIATAFATILNPSDEVAASCRIAPVTDVPAIFQYFQTDPLTNQTIGEPNPPIDIAPNGFATLVFSFQPLTPFGFTEIEFDFSCGNADSSAGSVIGVNSFQLAALGTPGADMVALSATIGNTGIVDISQGGGAFAVATTNIGVDETITATVDTGTADLPLDLLICETETATGVCKNPPAATAVFSSAQNSTATFAVFALLNEANGVIAFNPGVNRAFVRFRGIGEEIRGSTSVALRTVP